MRECTLITESRVEECGIVAQVVKCAPRVCGDDSVTILDYENPQAVLPAYAGMILKQSLSGFASSVLPAYAGMIPTDSDTMASILACSPRMRG